MLVVNKSSHQSKPRCLTFLNEVHELLNDKELCIVTNDFATGVIRCIYFIMSIYRRNEWKNEEFNKKMAAEERNMSDNVRDVF